MQSHFGLLEVWYGFASGELLRGDRRCLFDLSDRTAGGRRFARCFQVAVFGSHVVGGDDDDNDVFLPVRSVREE